MLVQKMGVKVDLSFIMAVTSLFADLPSRATEVGLGPALVSRSRATEVGLGPALVSRSRATEVGLGPAPSE